MNMDIAAFNNLLFRISVTEVNSGVTGEESRVEEIFLKDIRSRLMNSC